MAKLHELLAVEGQLKSQAQATRTELAATFKSKRHLFEEKVVTFHPSEENAEPTREQQSDLQSKVRDELRWIAGIWSKAIDASYQVAQANTRAFADVVLEDGTTLLAAVPATGLLELEKRVAEMETGRPEDKVSMVVFSGDLDRVLAAFVIATGAAAMGQKVDMYFTFWGLTAIKRRTDLAGKSLLQRMMAMMTPGSSQGLPVSRMYFRITGLGRGEQRFDEYALEPLLELMTAYERVWIVFAHAYRYPDAIRCQRLLVSAAALGPSADS